MNSYIDKEEMQNLASKYGNNHILDGKSFSHILKNEKTVTEQLNKHTTP